MEEKLTALLLGDIVGQSGCRALFIHLKNLIKKYNADVVVVNGENAADGFGITPEIADQIFTNGVSVITSGNHIWQKREIIGKLELDNRILRPANYPAGVPGSGYCVIDVKDWKVAVVNLLGRVRLSDVDCPFRQSKKIVKQVKNDTSVVLIDFHAESPEEKEALAYYVDGDVSAVVGTHTHVQTADERILSKGTAYITDLGMIGPHNSIIGFKNDVALRRSLTQLPIKMEVEETAASLCGVAVEISPKSGKALSIKRIRLDSDY